jgi:hypothetical protein
MQELMKQLLIHKTARTPKTLKYLAITNTSIGSPWHEEA